MADWQSASIKFDPFEPLKPPLQAALVVLETVEAILEAALAIVKAFSLDFGNPLKAIVLLLLAAVRIIINQLRSTGFSVLLVHPDFNQGDFSAVLNSVRGAYPAFEDKVVSKFFDTSDIYRPTYPTGSTVAMYVFYIGAETPGDLLGQIFALLNFLKHPSILPGLPAPVNLKARPVNQSGAAISQFRKLFDSDLDKAIQLEWQMPMAPAGGGAPGFIGSLASFYQSFRFPNFVVERSEYPNGEDVRKELKSQTSGKTLTSLQSRFKFAKPETKVTVVELNSGNPLRHFKEKFPITSTTGLAEGALTGTYRYLDKSFSDADRGKSYYYRVRAYFGDPVNYTSAGTPDDYSSAIKSDGRNRLYYDFGDGVTMGSPSPVVRGYVPRALPGGSKGIFNLYEDINRAVKAGVLLNFEFPGPVATDSEEVKAQKTGWGTLSGVGSQFIAIKKSCKDTKTLQEAFLFKTTVRRVSNQCSSALYSNPALADLVAEKWASGASEVVSQLESEKIQWGFIGNTRNVPDYLGKENFFTDGTSVTTGPYPVFQLSVEKRQKLADFLRLAMVSVNGQTKYLSWYSLTLGDVFPAFIPFIYDFEQFILALLKALDSALAELEAIIQTLIQKIQQLEAILNTLLALIDLLDIKVTVSILGVVNSNGSAQTLAQSLVDSQNKPVEQPYGLHSGLVVTAGGPGEGAIAALRAISFILQIPFGLSLYSVPKDERVKLGFQLLRYFHYWTMERIPFVHCYPAYRSAEKA